MSLALTSTGHAPDRPTIELELVVDPAGHGMRLDRFLVHHFGRISRHRVHQMIQRGRVSCPRTEMVLCKKSLRVKQGQPLLIRRPAPVEPEVTLDFAIVHRDPELLVIDKPGGLPVHPSARYWRHTLTALLSERFGRGHGWEIAHRLDRETSGLLLLGRHRGSATELKRAFFRRDIAKEYLALVRGRWSGIHCIDMPLGPALGSRIRIKVGPRALDDGGAAAQTIVEYVACGLHRGEPISLVRARPLTGRTHQIRVHLAAMGYPIVGDKLYGVDEARFLDVVEGHRPAAELEAELGLRRHALHAYRLRLRHPRAGVPVEFVAKWPADLCDVFDVREAAL